jgi:hypothetical protein
MKLPKATYVRLVGEEEEDIIFAHGGETAKDECSLFHSPALAAAERGIAQPN